MLCNPRTLLSFALITLCIAPTLAQELTVADKFTIYEQMNKHQAYIDHEGTCADAKQYADLYWPEGTFRVIDPNRDATVTGHVGIRSNYDSAHSIFPLYMWRHSVQAWEITEANAAPSGAERADAYWKWRVDWKANISGVVSTGTYTDVFEKRNGDWKVLHRTSRDDPNWPLYIFAPYSANADRLFKSSCGDTSL